MSPVSVVVADDHPLFRQALATTVATDVRVELLGEASDGHEAIDLVKQLDPDVALVDLQMPGAGGLDVLRTLLTASPRTRTVLLSAQVSGDVVHEALGSGAAGFLTKSETPDRVIAAVSDAARGAVVVSPDLQAGVFAEIAALGSSQSRLLSPREREILDLAAQGASGTAIGKALFISPATVKTHLQRACQKLGVSDRTAAVAEAMRRGLIN